MPASVKIFLLFLFTAIIHQTLHAQKNLAGTWKGTIYLGNVSFAGIMTLEQQGNKLTGNLNELASYDDIFVNFSIAGEISGDSVKLMDEAVISEFSKGSKWCKKKWSGTVKEINGVTTYRGMWENDGRKTYEKTKLIEKSKSVCVPDSFVLTKINYVLQDTIPPVAVKAPEPVIKKDTPAVAKVPAQKPNTQYPDRVKVIDNLNNKPKDTITKNIQKPVNPPPANPQPIIKRAIAIKKTIDVFSDSVKLAFYDNGEIDNDTISVWYNGKLIISKQMLKTTPLEYVIRLEPGSENLLEMFADNLGTIPPNTALLIFYDKGQRREIRIDSDTKTTGAVVLRKKE